MRTRGHQGLLTAHQLGQGITNFYHQIIHFSFVRDQELVKYIYDTIIIVQILILMAYHVISTLLPTLHTILK